MQSTLSMRPPSAARRSDAEDDAHSLLELDPSNLRTLKMLTALLIRLNDRENSEECLKELLLSQLRVTICRCP
jgi:hypothetical protein